MDWKNQDENSKEVSGDETFASPGSSLLLSSVYIYGAMLAIGGMVCFHIHRNLQGIFDIERFAALDPMLSWGVIGCGITLTLIVSYFFHDLFEDFQILRYAMMEMVGPLSPPALLFLAALSSLGEEVLFRGAIQPAAGLWPTAIFFGLVHIGPSLRFSSWTVWAFLAGLLLGWVFAATGSLFPPLAIHFGINLIMMIHLRNLYTACSSIADPGDILPVEHGEE